MSTFAHVETDQILKIASRAVHDFLCAHETEDETRWLLSGRTVAGVPAAALAAQVAARRKAKEKLPTFYATRGIVYPPALNLEQTSSEATARYKARVLGNWLGARVTAGADLTGGWGVDAFFLSALCTDFYYSEPQATLVALARHNHRQLARLHLHYLNLPLPQSLAALPHNVSFIYLDPSRRAAGKKAVALADYEPDVVKLLPQIFEKTGHLLVKTSPMLDVSLGVRALTGTKSVHVLAVENECKELVFCCERGYHGPVQMEAVDLSDVQSFGFTAAEEAAAAISYSEPRAYVYEPGAAILKAGAFRLVAQRFRLAKLHANTHLYTGNQLIPDFPGRIFEVCDLRPDSIPGKKAHVVTRNFPEAAAVLKKKLGLSDGGVFYVVAFTGPRSRHVLVCNRMK